MCVVLRLEWNYREKFRAGLLCFNGFFLFIEEKIPLMQRNVCACLVKCEELWTDMVCISLVCSQRSAVVLRLFIIQYV